MYYVWQQKMFQQIVTLDNSQIEIIHPGIRNLDSGPDFFNAKVRIDGTVWAGNIEMHVKASDWFKHNHQNDPAYNNVILHVVLQADVEIRLPSGEKIKTVVMKIPQEVMEKYHSLTAKTPYSYSAINCKKQILTVPSIIMHDWQTSLAVQRMLDKANRVKDLINNNDDSWPEAFYVILTRAFGTGINSDACERLARSLPYKYIQKHIDTPTQIEALLLGQAGLISDEKLQKEYEFLKAKFNLTPLPAPVWKASKLRPQSSPQIRLRALAYILNRNRDLFSRVMEAKDLHELCSFLYVPNAIGTATVHSIIINAVVPIMLAYGQWQGDDDLSEKAMNLLDSIPAESNRYMQYWIECGLPLRNALDTQAMLQLYKEYCEPHKCMRCRIGCWLLLPFRT